MTTEQLLRWAATATAVAALAWLAVQVDATVGPILAAVVVLLPATAVALTLWARELDARTNRREADAARARVEQALPPAGPQY